jgi:hypothetical protein
VAMHTDPVIIAPIRALHRAHERHMSGSGTSPPAPTLTFLFAPVP